jgi:TonB-dependent starch-binding outer membrane protein SusC
MKNFWDYYGRILPRFLSKKTIRVMKLTFFLSFFTIIQLLATESYSQMTKLTIKLEDVKISDALKVIENESEFFFLYSPNLIDVDRKVTVDAENESIKDILKGVFDEKVKFAVYDRQVILTPIDLSVELSESEQQKHITGTVTDNSGVPLAGVNVVVTGTTQGSLTDAAGKYSIEVSPGAKSLSFSFVGMVLQEINIGSSTQIDVTMAESSVGLEEVVVIGYGTQKKAAVSGSIVSVAPTKLEQSGVSNLSAAIAGITPGIIVRQTQGQVGKDDAEIYIRGKGTLGSTGALIVIDGIPDRGSFSRLNPDDIESFTVLKDASAAIYGARSANGVILITTKRGKNGKPKFNANVSTTVSQPTVLLQAVDSWKWAEFEKEQIDNMGQGWVPNFNDQQIQYMKDQSKPYEYANTNWGKITQKTWTPATNSSFSVSGGSDKLNYFLSSQYLKQNSLFKGDWPYEQFQARANFDAKLSKKLSMGLDFYNRRENRKYSKFETINDVNNGGNSWASNFVSTWPWLIGRFPNGYLGKGAQPSGGSNPLGVLDPANGTNTEKLNLLNTKLSFKWDIATGLSLSAYGAFDTNNDSRKNFIGIFDEYLYNSATNTYSKAADATKGELRQEKWNYSTNTFNIKLDYKKSFGSNNIDAFVSYEQSKRRSDMMSSARKDFAGNGLQELFAGGSTTMINDGRSTAEGRINYFGRVNYDYAGKYLATFSLRHDGSQNFPSDKRFGTFPGISLGWRLSEESFLKDNEVVNNLKLRGSWGKLGNDNINPFQYLGAYEFGVQGDWGAVSGYDYGNGEQPGFFESVVANPNVTWETATTTNFGLEGVLFNNSLSFDFDYFTSKRTGILIQRSASVPDYTGLVLPDENLGKVNNKGFEIQVSYHKDLTKDLSFVIGANMSNAKNEVVYFDEPASILPYQKYEGSSIDSYLMYQAIGIYQTQAEIDASAHGANIGPGSLQLLDANSDGKITADDRVRLNKNSIPTTQYGINLGVTFKNWELAGLITGQAGGYRMMNSYTIGPWFDNRWQKEGDNIYPRAETTYGQGSYNYNSSFFLESTDFSRLKNLSLTYHLPVSLSKKLNIENASIYIRGNNIAIITQKLKLNDLYSDPETAWSNGTPMRSWQIGVDFNF